jgi:YVTN family beta-propeller protein
MSVRVGIAAVGALALAVAVLLPISEASADAVGSTIHVGSTPQGVAFSPSGSTAYVTNSGSNTVSVIKVSSGTVSSTVHVGSDPIAVAFSPDGASAYVVDSAAIGAVTVINVATHTVSSTIPVGSFPMDVAFTPNGAKAYVTNSSDDTVSAIDTSTKAVTATLDVGSHPVGVAVSPDGAKAYVTNANDGNVSVITVASDAVAPTPIAVGSDPLGIAFSPTDPKAYVAVYGQSDPDSVVVIDTDSDSVTSTFGTVAGQSFLAFSPDGSKAYVADQDSNSVSVVDTSTDTVSATLKVGKDPRHVAFAPSGLLAYVTNTQSSSVSVLRASLVTTAPTITGTLAVGNTLTASVSGWTSGVSFTYEWLRDGKAIAPASASTTYDLVAADRGKQISVKAIGTKNDYPTASRTSTKTTAIGYGTFSPGTVSLGIGLTDIGDSVSADTSGWPAGVTLSYRWGIDGVAVKGATASTWTIPSSANGHFITLEAVGTKAGYTSVSVEASLGSKAAYGNFSAEPAPTITGTAQTGSTLHAVVSAWTPTATFHYQWLRNGVAAPGATSSSYLLPSSARNAQYQVRVIGSRDGFLSEVAVSDATSSVLGTLSGSTPKITGTAKHGDTLTAVSGPWTLGTTLSYEWRRYTGSAYVVVGTNSNTYLLQSTDVGKTIKVVVTGTLVGYAPLSKTSAATKKVI